MQIISFDTPQRYKYIQCTGYHGTVAYLLHGCYVDALCAGFIKNSATPTFCTPCPRGHNWYVSECDPAG